MPSNTHIIETGNWVAYLSPRIPYPFTSLQFLLPTSRKWVKSTRLMNQTGLNTRSKPPLTSPEALYHCL